MSLQGIRVTRVRKVFDDGNHDAFTDLCRFRNRLFLAFRSCPDGHGVHSTSRIVVLSSTDGEEWEQSFEFSVPGRDTRDPHFLVFKGRIFVYTGCWAVPSDGAELDLNQHMGFCAYSSDGRLWSGPVPLEGTHGHYIWRAACYCSNAYLCGRRRRNFKLLSPGESDPESIEAALLVSQDGLVWKFNSLITPRYGDETALLFDQDGTLVCIARGSGGNPASLCRSKPPYEEWSRVYLDRNLGGPLIAMWGDRYIIGGRDTTDPASPKTKLFWLQGDRLKEAAVLPSAGDNSYPGFVAVDEENALLSYYSTHEDIGRGPGATSIYLATLRAR